MSRVIHFEIPAEDPGNCMDFYRKIFGWEFKKWGNQDYWLAKTGNDNLQGINGAICLKTPLFEQVVNTISTQDIDRAEIAIEENGGAIIKSKMAVPAIGWLIYFKDPEGNLQGAIQYDRNAR